MGCRENNVIVAHIGGAALGGRWVIVVMASTWSLLLLFLLVVARWWTRRFWWRCGFLVGCVRCGGRSGGRCASCSLGSLSFRCHMTGYWCCECGVYVCCFWCCVWCAVAKAFLFWQATCRRSEKILRRWNIVGDFSGRNSKNRTSCEKKRKEISCITIDPTHIKATVPVFTHTTTTKYEQT